MDLKALLNLVATATSNETKNSIKEGVLDLIRANENIPFEEAHKLMGMAVQLNDHNTVVKLIKRIEDLSPVGESVVSLLATEGENSNTNGNVPPIGMEIFENLSKVIGKMVDKNLIEEELHEDEKIELPFEIQTVETDNKEVMDELDERMTKCNIDNMHNIIPFIYEVTHNIAKSFNVGDSIITRILEVAAEKINIKVDDILKDQVIVEEISKLRESLFALYVLHAINKTCHRESETDYMLSAIKSVEESIMTREYAELINYEKEWAVLCGNSVLVAASKMLKEIIR